MTINDRVELVIKMHNLTSSSFADQIGVQRSSVSHVLSGRNKPGVDFIEKILRTYPRVNAHWLLTGENIEVTNVNNSEDVVNKLAEDKMVTQQNELRQVGLVKIVEFYSDETFKVYLPNER